MQKLFKEEANAGSGTITKASEESTVTNNRERAKEIVSSASEWSLLSKVETALDTVERETREKAIRECEEIAVRVFPCNDPGHDDRWCSRCAAMADQGDLVAEEILKLLPSGKEV